MSQEELFHSCVGKLYEMALEPQGWGAFLDDSCALIDAAFAHGAARNERLDATACCAGSCTTSSTGSQQAKGERYGSIWSASAAVEDDRIATVCTRVGFPKAQHGAWYWALFTLLALAAAVPCYGQAEARRVSADAVIVFQHINDVVAPGTVKLSNGVEVARNDWPTLIMARIPVPGSDKQKSCTGTLVGPNVVLLAAHCVDSLQGRARRAQLWVGSWRVEMTCEMHPDYLKRDYDPWVPRASEDYALCLLEDGGKPLPPFVDISFEVVDATSSPSPENPVLMTGYGCDKLRLAPNGTLDWVPNFGKLRIGDERIDTPVRHWASDPAYLTTRSVSGREPALCPGDSGGPLFSGVSTSAPRGVRRIRGVNSKICARREGDSAMCTAGSGSGRWDIVSGISATGTDAFRLWALDWLRRNSAGSPIICGINRDPGVVPCRA